VILNFLTLLKDITMLLSLLKPKQKGKIKNIKDKVGLKERFMRMGLIPGEIIEIVRVAPLGDPVEILVKGYHLSLRKKEAECIEIESD